MSGPLLGFALFFDGTTIANSKMIDEITIDRNVDRFAQILR